MNLRRAAKTLAVTIASVAVVALGAPAHADTAWELHSPSSAKLTDTAWE